MRWRSALLAALLLAAPSVRAQDSAEPLVCAPAEAVYGDPMTGFRLSFRSSQPWEQSGNVIANFEAEAPDGQAFWGRVTVNMGTSRDMGHLYAGCPRPGPDDAPDPDYLADCLIWEGVIYALEDNVLRPFSQPAMNAAETIVLADLGRQLRYEVFDTPGMEPWDQLVLESCRTE